MHYAYNGGREKILARVYIYIQILTAHGHTLGHNLFGSLCKNRFVPAPFSGRRRSGPELTAAHPSCLPPPYLRHRRLRRRRRRYRHRCRRVVYI